MVFIAPIVYIEYIRFSKGFAVSINFFPFQPFHCFFYDNGAEIPIEEISL